MIPTQKYENHLYGYGAYGEPVKIDGHSPMAIPLDHPAFKTAMRRRPKGGLRACYFSSESETVDRIGPLSRFVKPR